MSRFTASAEAAVPAERLWGRITDWPAHGRWVPFTTVRVTSGNGEGVGARFVGRTAVGPFGFDDPMEVVEWRPPSGQQPGFCRVQKLGSVVLGQAWLEVTTTPGGSRVVWTEDVDVSLLRWLRLSKPAGPLLSIGGRLAFGRVLRTMARELEREAHTDG